MLSEQVVCQILKSQRTSHLKYVKENVLVKSFSDCIDKEENRTISVMNTIYFNRNTGHIGINSSIRYHRKNISANPREPTRKCNDPETRAKITHRVYNNNRNYRTKQRQRDLDTHFPYKEFDEIPELT